MVAGCAGKKCTESFDPLSDDLENEDTCEIFDPLESVNRVIYGFNDFLYRNVLDPIDTVYVKLPEGFRKGVRNFFHNASSPVRFIGSAMQGKSEALGIMGECMINSSFGLFGINDVVDYQYSDDEEDIGQGLASWGIGEGCYLVLPLFGPKTLRDAVGDFGASWLSPTTQLDTAEAIGYLSTETVDTWNEHSECYLAIQEKSIDPYTALKRSYMDNRRNRISR